MWQPNGRPHDKMSIKVNRTAKFTSLLCCNRIDEGDSDAGRRRQSLREMASAMIQTDGGWESCPALGLIKLPLLALIQWHEE